jgi:hypothetical protein
MLPLPAQGDRTEFLHVTPIYPETEMYPANSGSPKDNFFNDLPRKGNSIGSVEPPQSPNDTIPQDTTNEGGEAYVPRTKRIACVVCRKRKLSKSYLLKRSPRSC